MHNNVSFDKPSPEISENFKGIWRYIVNLLEFF